MTWEEVTAVSTLALAFVTWRLARSTTRLAQEAGAETRANWMPVVTPAVAAESSGLASSGLSLANKNLELTVRNIGRGPALNLTIALWDETARDKIYRGHSPADVIAPGETLVFEWKNFEPPVPDSSMGINVWSQVSGMITYGDTSSVRYETEIKIGFRADSRAGLIDQRFLGSARNRMTRLQRIRYRALLKAIDADHFAHRRKMRGDRLGRVLYPITKRIVQAIGRVRFREDQSD